MILRSKFYENSRILQIVLDDRFRTYGLLLKFTKRIMHPNKQFIILDYILLGSIRYSNLY